MRFISWIIQAYGEDDRVFNIGDIPDEVSQMVDGWLKELEEEE